MGDRFSSPCNKEAPPSTRVGTEETPERSDLREPSTTSSFSPCPNYNYPYYHQEPDYFKYQAEQYPNEQYSQSPDRRRRYISNSEPNDFRICLDNVFAH